jgi:hypothetical protein
MNIRKASSKLGIVATLAIAALTMSALQSVAIADPDRHAEHMEACHGGMHEFMKDRLERLSDRLEIRSSQLAAWEAYAKSVEALSEHPGKEPGEDATATDISHYSAERAAELAKRLSNVADSTAKLQSVLTPEQNKILNQASHRFLTHRHGWERDDRHEWMKDRTPEGREDDD